MILAVNDQEVNCHRQAVNGEEQPQGIVIYSSTLFVDRTLMVMVILVPNPIMPAELDSQEHRVLERGQAHEQLAEN